MLLREMPTDIRRMLQERIENMTFVEAAKVADFYFDSDGRPKHTSQTTTVNHVSKSFSKMSLNEQFEASEDESSDANAVGFGKKRFDKRPNGRNQQSRNPPFAQQARSTPVPQQSQAPQASQPKSRGPPAARQLCRYHQQFGDDAQTCKQGCPRFPKVPSNGKAGRQA